MTQEVSARRNSPTMQARRRRILDEARQMIMNGGVDTLNLRTLAEASDVAVRTIYSLVGRKDDVLIALYEESQRLFTARLRQNDGLSPLEKVEAVAIMANELYREDEEYHRSAYLAIEHLDEAKTRSSAIIQLFESGANIIEDGFQACIEAGLLEGHVDIKHLSTLALQTYRVIWTQWACEHISLDELRDNALTNAYVILMADAKAPFKKLLAGKVAALERGK